MKIYLAGPDVFLPDALEIGREKVAICARYDLIGLYPLDNTVILTTKHGKVTIKLRPDWAPKHVAQIKTLVKQKFYDGLTLRLRPAQSR